MANQTRFRTFQIKHNDNLSVPIGNLVWAQAFFERFGLDEVVRAFKTKGTDLAKLAEVMVAYKAGDNFSILRCHDFMMQCPIKETLGRNKEPIVTTFRKRFLTEYGPEVTDTVFDWTSLVYFGDKPEKAMRGHSKDGHTEECQVMIGVAQLAKPLGVPTGLTVEPGNTHDGKHRLRTFGQVHTDLSEGSTMKFDAGANNKTVLDTIIEDGKHYLTRKRFNKSDDAILAKFSEDEWECIDEEKWSIASRGLPVEVTVAGFRAAEPGNCQNPSVQNPLADASVKVRIFWINPTRSLRIRRILTLHS